MRLIGFYLRAKGRRRPGLMLARGMFFGTVIFCLTVLLLTLALRAGEGGIAHLAAELTGSLLALVGMHAVLLVCGGALLAAHDRQQNAAEYRTLGELGVTRRKLAALQLIETAILGLIGTAVFFPLAILAVILLTRGRVAVDVAAPWPLFAGLLPLMGVAMLGGTAIGAWDRARAPRVHADGELDAGEGRVFIDRFTALMRRRCRGWELTAHVLAAVVLAIPLLCLVAAGAQVGDIRPASWDCTVTPPLREGESGTILYGIPDAMVETVRALPGAVEEEVETDLLRGVPINTRIAVRFADEARAAGCDAMAALEGIGGFVLRDNYHTHLAIRATRAALRDIALMLALATMPMALLMLALLRESGARAFDARMAVLYGLGLNLAHIRRAYRRDAMRDCLIDGALVSVAVAVLYAAGTVEGGGTLPLGELLAVILPYLAVQVMLGAVVGRGAYRRFLRKSLNKTVAEQEG